MKEHIFGIAEIRGSRSLALRFKRSHPATLRESSSGDYFVEVRLWVTEEA